MRLAAGTMLGPYEVLAPLGSGGMGEVYRARDSRLRREVAIKVLPQASAGGSEWERFQREARAASALNHPNICTIFDAGESDGQPYLVMELLEGETLQQRLSKGPLDEVTATAMAIQIADALAAAHSKGILHRDIKPGNIMLVGRGHVKVLDFGLAKQTAGTLSDETLTMAPATVAGSIVGTPAYLAPELLQGEKADARSDVWALGVVLYQMLSGQLPFRGGTAFELSAAILKEPLKPLAGISTGLQQIVAWCLAKDRHARMPGALEVRDRLEQLRMPIVQPAATRRSWLWLAAAPVLAGAGYFAWRQRSDKGSIKLLSTGDPASANADANREYELGMTAIRVSNDIPKAIAAFQRALDIDPKFSSARRNHAFFTVVSLWNGFTGDTGVLYGAEQELMQVQREAPDLVSLPAAQSAVYLMQGRLDSIELDRLDQVMRDNPDRIETGMWRAVVHNFAEENEQAKKLLQAIIDQSPVFVAARTFQAELQRQEQDFASAERALKAVLEQAPDAVAAQMTLIDAYLDQGKIAAGREMTDRARSLSERNFLIRLTSVAQLAAEGKSAEALSEFTPDLQTYASTVLLVTLGVAEIYASLGDREKALEWVERAVRNGDRRINYMRRAPRLKLIQGDPRFQSILQSVEARRRR